MGRPAHPDAVLKLHGSYRKDRHGARGPKTGGDPLRKPDDLSEHASWLWDEVTRVRAPWLASSDAASLRLLCDAYALMRACEPRLHACPVDKASRHAWSCYAGTFTKLAAQFGLTPSDRAKLGEDKPERDASDELEAMLR